MSNVALDPTTAFVTVVAPDRTIQLPNDVPVGATVAVVLVPAQAIEAEAARRERFERMREALRSAPEPTPAAAAIDDATLDALIDRARRA